jgi:Fe-S cluster assembly iron-binding protein IscA
MLIITESAKSELARFSREEVCDDEFVRITRAYQCGGPRFQLIVDDTRTSMDETLTFKGFEIVVDNSCKQLLKDCEIEFNQNGFQFVDQLQNQC